MLVGGWASTMLPGLTEHSPSPSPLLQAGKAWLFANAELIVAAICFGLAAYLGWQGIEGLRAG